MRLGEIIVSALVLYLSCGLLFSVLFLAVGVDRIDPAARQTSIAFRLLIFPGTVALWPVLAAKWAKTYVQRAVQ
jgi:hypothetical protein